jgi:response regulator NasT
LLTPVSINQLIIEIETALHFDYEKKLLNRRKDNMNTTIENNRKISLAIGLVMERFQINGGKTFDVLRSAARNNQSRVLDVANKLIKDHETIPMAFV